MLFKNKKTPLPQKKKQILNQKKHGRKKVYKCRFYPHIIKRAKFTMWKTKGSRFYIIKNAIKTVQNKKEKRKKAAATKNTI